MAALYQHLILVAIATIIIQLRFVNSQACGLNDGQHCKCKREVNCRYVGDHCLSEVDACGDMAFHRNEFRRNLAFYAFRDGNVCRNRFGAGGNHTARKKVIRAVNLGGPEHTDMHGVYYHSGDHEFFQDALELAKTSSVPIPVSRTVDEDRDLWGTFLYSNGSDMLDEGGENCVTFGIPVHSRNAEYELTLKMLEPRFTLPGHRYFNVKFNGLRVFDEIDILALTGRKGAPLDLRLNYKIVHEGQLMLIKGFADRPVRYGTSQLSFCMGSCGDSNEGETDFVVSAFSVIQISPSPEKPPQSHQSPNQDDVADPAHGQSDVEEANSQEPEQGDESDEGAPEPGPGGSDTRIKYSSKKKIRHHEKKSKKFKMSHRHPLSYKYPPGKGRSRSYMPAQYRKERPPLGTYYSDHSNHKGRHSHDDEEDPPNRPPPPSSSKSQSSSPQKNSNQTESAGTGNPNAQQPAAVAEKSEGQSPGNNPNQTYIHSSVNQHGVNDHTVP